MPRFGLASLARRAREIGEDVTMVARLTRDLPSYLRTTLTADGSRSRALYGLATREHQFLAVVERAIYGYPRSPYLKLLRHAGCELGDFRDLLAREGVEGALKTLSDQGVYVTFDEFKGRREAVRGSQRFTFRQEEFDNPLLRPHFLMYTGGTGGRPNRVGLSLAHMDGWADSIALALEAHGLHRPPVAFWWPIALPRMAAVARIGCPVVGWFYPVHPLPKLAHLMAYYQALLGRLGGYRFPLPERCDLETPEQMVDWLTMQLQTGRSIVVWTMASAGVRIGIAASAAGRDLRGVTLFIGSEAVTDTRRRHMESSGAQVIARYTSTEFVGLAYSCPTSAAADDVHVMLDRYAIVERLRPSSEGGPVVNALLVTSLSTTSSKIALNTEMGDYARVEERDCGCLLGELGMRTHLSEIRSFEKLTGEGVSFARSNLEQILEEVLPRRFGGTSLDYQIAEEEGPDSATRLVLRVSPSAGEMDEAVLSAALLEELGKGGLLEQYQAGAWRTAGTIEIRREPPLATQAGKVLPLHLLRRDSRRP